jgi:hypothetical protein
LSDAGQDIQEEAESVSATDFLDEIIFVLNSELK